MIGNDPGYQAWMDAIRRQMAIYQQQTDNARGALSYIAAPQSPATFGYAPAQNASNALMSRANNTATALLSPTNPFNFQLMNYMMNAPGGNTIGLPGDSGVDSSNALLAQLLGRSGVG